MITQYDVITSRKLADLQERVLDRIREGWQPLGGIAAVHEDAAGERDPHMVFAQAIVMGANGKAGNS
jgi:hypothetical protein